MLRALAAVTLVAISGAAEPPRDFRFTTGRGALGIPFESVNQQISLLARVNERDSVWLVLDSAGSGAVLDTRLASILGLESVGQQRSFGAGGAQEGSIVRGVRVELPGFQLWDQTMDTLPLDALAAQTGLPFDGILGQTLFERCVVQIDYAQRCVSLFDPATWEYHGAGREVPLEFTEGLPYVEARIVLPGDKAIEGRFVIDTGSTGGLILSPEPVEREGILAAVGKTLAVSGRGVGGAVDVRMGRVQSLELSGFVLARPITVFQPQGTGRVSAPGTLGNIGGGILRRFTVIFDNAHKRMILEPGAAIAAPFEADMSGLAFVSAPPEPRRIRVVRVLDDSPAREAGVQPGDEIETVDGTPAGEIGIPRLRERFRRDGEDVRLELRRGTERIAVTLRMRRLI